MANNWENRQYINLGPKFRIESNNPQVGFHGPGVYDIYGNNDQGDVSLMGMTEGGTFRLYNDKSIEIVGCLLYTSPSPRDLSTSRMPSSA